MDRLDRIEAALERFAERHETLIKRHEALTERHEKLTERHEALAQSVEILTHDIQELRNTVEADGKHILTLASIARDVLASVQSLERTATAHQDRLDEHGERIRRIEDQGPR